MASNDTPTTTPPPSRIAGLDVARAVAIAGMTLIHMSMTLSGMTSDDTFGGWFINRLDGRPATIFMTLAGIGISLRFSGRSDPETVAGIRRVLRNRGLFFLIFGYLFLTIWDGDILRVYGIGFLLASLLVTTLDRVLWTAAVLTAAAYVGMIFVFDFGTNWNFDTLEYANLWTVSGGLMHLFYNGFRSVFPWVGLLFVGMLIGRRDLRDTRTRRRLLLLGLLLWFGTEAVSYQLLDWTLPHVDAADREDVATLLGTDSLPSLPLFLLSSSGFALVAIMACVEVAEAIRQGFWQPIASAGRMAFTWYIIHAVVVLGAGLLTDFQGGMPLSTMYAITAVFCGFMILSSWLYQQTFRHGPLEWLLRRTT